MKKISMIFAMAAMALASCVKEQAPVVDGEQDMTSPDEVLVEKTFTVENGDTKTYIDGSQTSNGKLVLKWCAGDEISVWDGFANRKFTMVGEPDGASATFKGMVSEAATEFYAIYPYDENLQYSYVEDLERMVFTVNKPAVQYANPEGGLADGAAYSCGKADAEGNIKFVNRSALLKFSISASDVKSVSLKGNEDDDIIAGKLGFRYDATNTFSLGWQGSVNTTEVTLCNEDGTNLKTGVDYYMSLTGNKFDKGFTVTLTFADGTQLSRSSDKAIQLMSSQVYTLSDKPLSRTLFGKSYYEAYTAGEDIMIGGKAYNKTTHPNATLLTTTSTISKDGLYFVRPEDGAEIKYGTTRLGDVVIIGDLPGTRQKLGDAPLKLAQNAKIAILNCYLHAGAGQQLIDENVTADYVAFDDCTVVNVDGKPLCYASGGEGTLISEFVMVNSEFKVPEATSQSANGVYMFNGGLTGSTLRIENNVFYVDKADVVALKFKFTTQTTALGALILKNNTFINMSNNAGNIGYFSNGVTFESIDVRNNLFYVPLMTTNHYVFVEGGSFDSGTTSENAYYKGDNEKTFRMFNGSQNTPSFASTDLTKLAESPFSSMDHADGVFVKTAAAAAYGAKR